MPKKLSHQYPAGTKKGFAFVASIEPSQLAHPCSLTKLHTVGMPFSNSHLDISKIDNGQFRWKVG